MGGEAKSVRPQAIMLHSGDIVVMSGQSRVAYHGVPKIICPSASSPIPESLNRHTLLDCVQRSAHMQQDGQADSICCVCGREKRWTSATKHDVREDIPSLSDDSSLEDRLPVEPESACLDHTCGRTSEGLGVSPGKRLKREPEADTSSVDIEDVCCAELVREWTDFEHYLSTSRININVRQVNNHE